MVKGLNSGNDMPVCVLTPNLLWYPGQVTNPLQPHGLIWKNRSTSRSCGKGKMGLCGCCLWSRAWHTGFHNQLFLGGGGTLLSCLPGLLWVRLKQPSMRQASAGAETLEEDCATVAAGPCWTVRARSPLGGEGHRCRGTAPSPHTPATIPPLTPKASDWAPCYSSHR